MAAIIIPGRNGPIISGSFASASAMSLVLAQASSQYLTRTWGSSPTDNKAATIAFFIKRVGVSYPDFFQDIYDGGIWDGNAGVDEASIRFRADDSLDQSTYNGASLSTVIASNTITADSTWHHVCYRFDSANATANSRMRIYIDGTEVSYGTQTMITQNGSYHLTDNTKISAIGRAQASGNRYLDAKLAYFYLIDGQSLAPSNFTTGTGSGTTHPAAYGGTYGTNGFFLNFTGSATTDQSGNTNNWTQNGSPTFSSDVPT